MFETILSLFTGGNGLLAGLAAALVAIVGVFFAGRRSGTLKADNKALKQAVAAKEEQLEMHREATQAEREAGALSDKAAREEALRWSRKQ